MLGTQTFRVTRQHSYLQARHRHLLYLSQSQTETSSVIPLHISQTQSGAMENHCPGMNGTPCAERQPLWTGRTQLSVNACLLDDTLQAVLTEHLVLDANMEGTFWVILDDINFNWSGPRILFLVSQVNNDLWLMNLPSSSLCRNTSKLQCTSPSGNVGRGASGCSGI